jgi:hypothetical protein
LKGKKKNVSKKKEGQKKKEKHPSPADKKPACTMADVPDEVLALYDVAIDKPLFRRCVLKGSMVSSMTHS